ncbi:MAG TPA: hypothetical protein VM368_07185 [Flavisolibacter sp.]|nr:hypothetical protein [Flavisolibacter sp.]
MNRITSEGYDVNFRMTNDGVESTVDHHRYKPEEIQVVNFFHFQGEQDPASDAILYIIETTDGKKGTLIDTQLNNRDPKLLKFTRI